MASHNLATVSRKSSAEVLESHARSLFAPPSKTRGALYGLFEMGPLRKLVDLPKPFAFYRNFLNHRQPAGFRHRGIYGSFAEALASVPKHALAGRNHPEIARMYLKRADSFSMTLGEFPALLWLRRTLQAESRVFEFGGNVGTSFYSWERYFPYPENVSWKVCDVVAMVETGSIRAKTIEERRLRFTTGFEEASGADIFLSTGSLQYVETPIWTLLRDLPRLPRHLILNRVPLHETANFITLENADGMATPYQVFNRIQFVTEVEALGYELCDHWADAQQKCRVPFYPERSIDLCTGMYFRRKQ